MTRNALSFLPLIALAACAHSPIAEAPPPPTVAAQLPPPVMAPTPINAGLTAAATVWHLRAGLNVAALACRGPEGAVIVERYNTLLRAQKPALAAAEADLAAEFRTGGGDWRDRYDDAMTRLYNFFSQSPARERFCAAAATVLADTAMLAPGALTDFAAERLPQIDAPFAAAADAMVAAAPRARARPKLEIDVASLADR